MPVLSAVAESGVTQLSSIVTGEMMQGVLTQITGLLPVVIPVMVGFIGLRKGIQFLPKAGEHFFYRRPTWRILTFS